MNAAHAKGWEIGLLVFPGVEVLLVEPR